MPRSAMGVIRRAAIGLGKGPRAGGVRTATPGPGGCGGCAGGGGCLTFLVVAAGIGLVVQYWLQMLVVVGVIAVVVA
ncbi:MAG TPA: hypothetical protein VIK32_07465, partial [Candidatus Limnocylindrales bacterium]